jgi:hypothetical protein
VSPDTYESGTESPDGSLEPSGFLAGTVVYQTQHDFGEVSESEQYAHKTGVDDSTTRNKEQT